MSSFPGYLDNNSFIEYFLHLELENKLKMKM